ncbi:hypothetical protein MHBO_002924 [Bonamia ostreae]|uniref:Uncharacterized protein n=1 Tax=Bonamia ostreae TaxID=126728 RepID=A0ABV2AP02_9EUKA
MLKLNLIAESITSTISKLSAMFLKSAQTKSPIIIFVNKSVLLPTPKTIENGQNAFCHFWLINNKRKHCHFWLNFTNILQCLVEEKRFENDFETGKICVLKDINSKIKEKEVLVKIKENLVKLFEGNGVKRMEEIVEKIVLGICEEVGVKFDGV